MTAEGFIKCDGAPWQLPTLAIVGVWAVILAVYGVVFYQLRNRANKIIRDSFLTGLILALCYFPIFYYNARLASLFLPVVILCAFDTQLKLTKAGFKAQSNFFTVYIAWLFYMLSLTAYSAIKCPPVDVSYIPEDIQQIIIDPEIKPII